MWRDDGLSYDDHDERLKFSLLPKMADVQGKAVIAFEKQTQ